MKIVFQTLTPMLLALSIHAASLHGDIALPYSLLNTNEIAVTTPVGDAVKASWSCRVSEFYGWQTLFARLTVTNTGARPMWGQCCLAFYDKDRNLVGTATQAFLFRRGLKPRTARALNFCRLVLAKDRYKDIASYEVVLHEIDTPPLKKKESILLEDP